MRFVSWLQGVIISLKDNEGIIKSDQHGQLPFHVTENFSDVELTTDDINEEVEFTVIMVRLHLPTQRSSKTEATFTPQAKVAQM